MESNNPVCSIDSSKKDIFFHALLIQTIADHSFPWSRDYDWTEEILDAHDKVVLKPYTQEDAITIIALAEALQQNPAVLQTIPIDTKTILLEQFLFHTDLYNDPPFHIVEGVSVYDSKEVLIATFSSHDEAEDFISFMKEYHEYREKEYNDLMDELEIPR